MTNHHGEPQQAFDMTNDTRNDPLIDPALSDHLKSIPGETTPTGLDAAILREAKRAIRADNRSGTTAAWFRPLAFVVTVGLSLAIILELSESGILAPASDPDRVASPAGSGPPAAMPNGSRGNRDQATLNELKRQEKTPTAARQAEDAVIATDTLRPEQASSSKMQPESPPPQGTRAGEAFSVESEKAMQRLQVLDADRETASPSRAASPAQDAAPGAAGLETSSSAACPDAQRTTPDAWWKCIESLRRSGQQAAADRETESLRKAFPDFELPL